MKKVLIIVSLTGAFFSGAIVFAREMWNDASKNLTPEEFETFYELVLKTFQL